MAAEADAGADTNRDTDAALVAALALNDLEFYIDSAEGKSGPGAADRGLRLEIG
jgi:hypothetical protein